jgi:GNAT superfamily N-acetyltransferase
MSHSIIALSDRPRLAATVAAWLVDAFERRPGGRTIEERTALLLAPRIGLEETFVLLDGEVPAATASLAHSDLASRPDLTPWLASVFVLSAFRGRGHATTLVRQVEAFASAASVQTLWLYTPTAEPLYARLGWERVGLERDRDQDVVLMRRHLSRGY